MSTFNVQLHLAFFAFEPELVLSTAIGAGSVANVNQLTVLNGASATNEAAHLSVMRLGSSVKNGQKRTLDYLSKVWSTPELMAPSALSRRVLPDTIERRELLIEFAAPKQLRSSDTNNSLTSSKASPDATTQNYLRRDWLSPVTLKLEAFYWTEAKDRHHALVPAIGLQCMGQDLQSLLQELPSYVQKWLRRRQAKTGLRELAHLASWPAATLAKAELALNWKRIKQREQARSQSETRAVLHEVADLLSSNNGVVRGDQVSPNRRHDGKVPRDRRHDRQDVLLAWKCEQRAKELAYAVRGAGSAAQLSSVLIVAPSGSGKSTCVRWLAQHMAQTELAGHPLWHTTGARLIAGQSGFGMWQARCQAMIRELRAGQVEGTAVHQLQGILHIGNLVELMEVGRTSSGEQSIAAYLRQEVAHGTVCVLAECSPEQLSAIERLEPGLIAAFQTLQWRAPNADQCADIVQADLHYHLGSELVARSAAAIKQGLALHERYAGNGPRPAQVLQFFRGLVCRTAWSATLVQDQLRDSGAQSKSNKRSQAALAGAEALTVSAVNARFAAQTGLPLLLIDPQVSFEAEAVRAVLSAQVIGQAPAIEIVIQRLQQIKANLHRRARPLASLLCIGPTGTGKTELAKALARFLFGSVERLTRFDLSQVNSPGAVQRLIGSSHFGEREGLLTAKIREQPFSVLLLDEFEKADPSFFDLLLQMLGDGRLTDGSGRVADFSNAVILLTSNLGASDAMRQAPGFQSSEYHAASTYEQALQRFVRPELFNRFDAIVPFAALSRAHIEAITQREVGLLLQREGARVAQVDVDITATTISWLAQVGFDPRFGARALKRALEQRLTSPLAAALFEARLRVQREAKSHWRIVIRHDPVSDKLLTEIARVELKDSGLKRESDIVIGALKTALPDPIARLRIQQTDAISAQRLRRRSDQLLRGARVVSLQDESVLLAQRKRRALKRHDASAVSPDRRDLWAGPSATRLDLLERALEQVREHYEQCALLEDQCLSTLWKAEENTFPTSLEAPAARITKAERILEKLVREVYSLGLREPNRCAFVLFSEHADWLHTLLVSYRDLAKRHDGDLQLLGLFERIETAAKSGLTKEPMSNPYQLRLHAQLKHPDAVFHGPITQVFGVFLEAKGPLFAALFGLEAGLHNFQPEPGAGAQRHALFEVIDGDPLKYEPYSELWETHAIKQSNLPVRRSFNREKLEILDAQQVPQRGTWTSSSVSDEILWRTGSCLQRALASVIDEQDGETWPAPAGKLTAARSKSKRD
jgi:ATP-dependent Clp protease ATP-binding subunit ClpA